MRVKRGLEDPHRDSVRGEKRVLVLEKAIVLLDALKAREMTLTELAIQTDMNKTTVHRLLRTLRSRGLVEVSNDTRRFKLGLKLLEYGASVRERLDLRREALPHMVRLADVSEMASFLCIRREDDAFCLERVEGRHVQTLVLRVGTSLPLHAGAASLVLLAAQPDAWIRGYARRARRDVRPLLESVARTRAQGFAISDQDVLPGLAAVGAPVHGDDGAVVAALSVSSVREAFKGRWDDVARLVQDATAETSRSLGYTMTASENGFGAG